MPGLVVVAPSTAADNYGLLRSSIASGDPVVYMEHKELWGTKGEVESGSSVPLGRAATLVGAQRADERAGGRDEGLEERHQVLVVPARPVGDPGEAHHLPLDVDREAKEGLQRGVAMR